jgi:hypothetical protein
MSADAAELSAPDTIKGKLQRKLLAMLRDRERNGLLPTNVRFLFYELVQMAFIAKQRQSTKPGAKGRRADQDVIDAVFWLRDKALVPWDWIVDETRQLHAWSYAATVAAYLVATVEIARIDCWDGELPPMILTESRSLAGVLREVAAEYLCPIAATNGQVGGFLRTDIAPQLQPDQHVLYLGDLDLSGGQIEENTRRVLEQLIGGELRWERLAITEQQVSDLNLRHLAIRKADKRYNPPRYHDAIETETLGQGALIQILRQRLDQLLPEPLADVQEREHREQERVRAALRRLR